MFDLMKLRNAFVELLKAHGLTVPDLRMAMDGDCGVAFQGIGRMEGKPSEPVKPPTPPTRKDILPEFMVVEDKEDGTFGVESKDGLVMDGITSFEAARLFAALCCIGHVFTDNDGYYCFSPDYLPDGVEIFDEDEDGDVVAEDATSNDDAPEEDEDQKKWQKEVDAYYAEEEAMKLLEQSTRDIKPTAAALPPKKAG